MSSIASLASLSGPYKDDMVERLTELKKDDPNTFALLQNALPKAADMGVQEEHMLPLVNEVAKEPNGELAFAFSEQDSQVADLLFQRGYTVPGVDPEM